MKSAQALDHHHLCLSDDLERARGDESREERDEDQKDQTERHGCPTERERRDQRTMQRETWQRMQPLRLRLIIAIVAGETRHRS